MSYTLINLISSDSVAFACELHGTRIPVDSWVAERPVTPSGQPARIAPVLAWMDTGQARLGEDACVHVSHHAVADLLTGELSGLGLPSAFPHRLEISSRGNIAREDFRFEFSFLRPNM